MKKQFMLIFITNLKICVMMKTWTSTMFSSTTSHFNLKCRLLINRLSSSSTFPMCVATPLADITAMKKWLTSVNISKSTFSEGEEKRILVYTDGCCLNQHEPGGPRSAGIGINWGSHHPLNVSSRLIDKPITSNRAEILAVHVSLQIAKELQLTDLLICTDSLYVVNAFDKWLMKWCSSKWQRPCGRSVKNVDLWKPFIKDVLSTPVSVKLKHVSKTPCIKVAHDLANKGARLSID